MDVADSMAENGHQQGQNSLIYYHIMPSSVFRGGKQRMQNSIGRCPIPEHSFELSFGLRYMYLHPIITSIQFSYHSQPRQKEKNQ